MLNIAIVGCGGIARVHAESARSLDNARLVAFADNRPERAEAFAAEYGGKAYPSLEAMLDAEAIDVLHICTPHYLHTPMAIAAHARGVHVFLEKPPATTRTDWRLLEEGFAGGPKLGVCFQNRFIDSVQAVKALLDGNAYGKVLGARAFVTWSRPAPYYTDSGWRGQWSTEGGGVLVNQSIHTLDLLVYLLGKPGRVEASCANHHLKETIGVEDTVEAFIQFGDRNALFYATTGFCTDSPVFVELVCEKGRIRMEGNTVTQFPQDGAPVTQEYKSRFLGKEYWGAGHLICIARFYDSLEGGEPFPIDLAAVRNTMDLMMGIFESSLTRQEIALGK